MALRPVVSDRFAQNLDFNKAALLKNIGPSISSLD